MEQINLNIIPDGVMPVCHASQFDKNRTIRFNLNQNGSVYTLAGTETITCKVRKPDDTESTINVANTSSSYVDVTFGFSDTDLSGYAMCELKIVNGAQTIGSRNFLLRIEADAYDGSVFEERSASGEIASFETNFIDNLTECIVDIDAVQDLHGYSKPWSGGGGKNKLEPCITSGTVDGISYTANDDGTITLSNTATSESKKWGFFDLKAGSYIYTSGVTESLDTYDTYLSVGGTTIARGSSGYNSFTLEQDSNVGLTIRVRNGITPDITIKPMIRLPDTSADFEPYENICPISGWSECNIHKSGINLWDEEWEVGSINDSGVNAIDANKIRSKNYIPIIPNTDFFITCPSTSKNGKAFFYDNNQTFISSAWFYGNATTTTPSNACYMRFRMVDSYGTTYNHDISINYPATDTDYHAFNGGTDTIPLGQTVCGGSLNVSTGLLTIDKKMVNAKDFNDWSKAGSVFYRNFSDVYRTITEEYPTGRKPLMCSHFNYQSSSVISDYGIGYGGANNNGNITIRYDALSTITDWNTYISNNDVLIVYPLDDAYITTIQLTPTEVRTLLGNNNIFADTGDIEVKYLIEVV